MEKIVYELEVLDLRNAVRFAGNNQCISFWILSWTKFFKI